MSEQVVERTVTLRGGPQDGREIRHPAYTVINIPEVLHLRAAPGAPTWVSDDYYAITHRYNGLTGDYMGVWKWPQVGPWSRFGLAPFPSLTLFPRVEAWQRRAQEYRRRYGAARMALRGDA